MSGCIKLAHINSTRHTGQWLCRVWRASIIGLLAIVLAGCTLPFPLPSELPVNIPGVPRDLGELEGLLGELGVPDLSELANVPGLDAFGNLQTPAGAIAFQGPVDMVLATGDVVPGTDIRFTGAEAGAEAAQFEIAGLRAPRRLGDSLDFDGVSPGIEGVSYHVRLRVYQISDGTARAAGVHRLVIDDIAPQAAEVNEQDLDSQGQTLRFPHTVTAAAGATFAGMTVGYGGQDARGAVLTGLPAEEYPYRKIGDSVEWAGMLAPNLPVVYHLRVLYYQDANATVGGVVIVSLPEP